jgi:hypothetical protein
LKTLHHRQIDDPARVVVPPALTQEGTEFAAANDEGHLFVPSIYRFLIEKYEY